MRFHLLKFNCYCATLLCVQSDRLFSSIYFIHLLNGKWFLHKDTQGVTEFDYITITWDQTVEFTIDLVY